MMRTLFLCLLTLCVFFAQSDASDISGEWVATSVLALFTAALILALLYMLAKGMELRDLSVVANEELYQLLATAMMLAILGGMYVSLSTPVITFRDGELFNVPDNGPYSIIGAASVKLSDLRATQSGILSDLMSVGQKLGAESSKSFFCSLQGVGLSINSCASFRALSAPLSLSFQALSIGLTELSALSTLIGFAQQYGFTLFLPLGILLRSFKFSRGAGAFLIALAFSLHIVVPASTLFMLSLVDAYESSPLSGHQVASISGLTVRVCDAQGNNCDSESYSCDEEDMGISNAKTSSRFFKGSIPALREYTYSFLFRDTLVLIVALVSFAASMRSISRAVGADVDVTSLVRLS